jgi:predicted TIM-barrel fold metal-dependent hydrolase
MSTAVHGVNKTFVIDTDIHESLSSWNELLPYLEPHWQRYITDYDFGPELLHFPYPKVFMTRKADYMVAPSLQTMRAELLDKEQVDIGILTGSYYFSALPNNYELTTAVATAYNNWQIDNYLNPEPRLRGSVHVVADDPEAAAREIDRVAEHPQIVQVFLPIVNDRSYGEPRYLPIFEAAARNNLVVTFHLCGRTRVLNAPRYAVEYLMMLPITAMTLIANLIVHGVFDKFPELRVVVLENGISWLPSFMMRMDQKYLSLRLEIPWVKRMPSEIMRNQVRISTQPIEDFTKENFIRLLDQVGTDRMLMFATDYPHHDSDSPTTALPAGLSDDLRSRILHRNAQETYPRLRSAQATL